MAIAIETDQGAVVYALLERPWITIYPVHPATSTRHRTMFRPSGAADDLPDALVLLSLLQHHRPRLRPLQLDDEPTRTRVVDWSGYGPPDACSRAGPKATENNRGRLPTSAGTACSATFILPSEIHSRDRS